MSFNPRPCARGDGGLVCVERKRNPVSIHAPARGATYIMFIIVICKGFQSTPLREGRQNPDRERRRER